MAEAFSITCPTCKAELGIEGNEINTLLKCDCGYEFIIDDKGVVSEVDYHAVPRACEEYLTEAEKNQRRSAYKNEFDRLTKGADFVDGLSVDSMIEVRQEQVKKIQRKRLKGNLGCIGVLLFPIACMVWFACAGDRNWVVLFHPVGLFIWLGMGVAIHECFAKHKEDADDPVLFASARQRELVRLLDNTKAKARWEDRKVIEAYNRKERERLEREQEASRRAAQAKQEEIRRIEEEALRNDQCMAEAIINGVVKFDKFVENLDVGDGHGYEERLMRFVCLCGLSCKRVANSADHGVDLILSKGKLTVAVQCKFKSAPIGNDAVQQVYTGRAFYHCDKAWVVSNCAFTRHAIKEAKVVAVELIGHNELFRHINALLDRKPLVDDPPLDNGSKRNSKLGRKITNLCRGRRRMPAYPDGALVTTTEAWEAIRDLRSSKNVEASVSGGV